MLNGKNSAVSLPAHSGDVRVVLATEETPSRSVVQSSSRGCRWGVDHDGLSVNFECLLPSFSVARREPGWGRGHVCWGAKVFTDDSYQAGESQRNDFASTSSYLSGRMKRFCDSSAIVQTTALTVKLALDGDS